MKLSLWSNRDRVVMRSLVVVEETCMISHTKLLQSSISQLLVYNKLEVFLEGWLHSIEFDRMSILFDEWLISTQNTAAWCFFFPSTMQVLCTTWFFPVNLCGIFVLFVPGINGQQKNTVCLLLEFWPPNINPLLITESRLKAHLMW